MFKYLFNRQARYRENIFKKIGEKLLVQDLRKRVSPNKWSIEELIRHSMFTTDYWMKRIVLRDNKTPLHPIGVENDTQATVWYSLDEISQGFNEVFSIITNYLEKNPDYCEIIPFDGEEFMLKWVFWHILQHELETWGQIAERIRTYGYPTLWEF